MSALERMAFELEARIVRLETQMRQLVDIVARLTDKAAHNEMYQRNSNALNSPENLHSLSDLHRPSADPDPNLIA